MKKFFIYSITAIIIILYLSFIFIPVGLILSILVFYLASDNEILRFHILQMAILALTFFLLSVIFIGSALLFLHVLIFIPYFLTFLILAVIQIYFLIKNKKIKLPVVGEVAENLMKGRV